MKATKTWSFAGLLLLAGSLSVSCGKDEAAGGSGGTGTVLTGGTGGASAGTGGTRTNGGTGGTGTATSPTKLGRACVTKADCMDANAPNLTCITSKDAVLGDGAPPKGLCTQECTLPTADMRDDPCTALGAGAMCYPFSTDQNATTGYCVEGCTFGAPDIGQPKCHSRPDFACNPALLGATDTACTTAEGDCQSGELCVQGACNVIFPACLPACRGDIDCEAGTYCDQSFLDGVCVTTEQTGKGLGEPCTPNAATEPDEPDECLGFCRADDDTGKTGHCATSCTLGAACAYNAVSKKFDGACLSISTTITGNDAAPGDFGFCAPTCNCPADCQDATLGCEVSPQGALPEQYRGGGLCFPPDATSKPYDQCGAGGSPDPGAGGSPAAAAGAGGAP